jgi:hypothetical protein
MTRKNKWKKLAPEAIETGVSTWKAIDEIKQVGLKWSKNGNQRHGKFFGIEEFLWDTKRDKRRAVTHLRTTGLDPDVERARLLAKRPISETIKNHFENQACVACGFCGKNHEMAIDHKNDLYDDPRVHNTKTQLISDFQRLCNTCNLIKRAVCRKTKEQGKRQPAPFQLLQVGCPEFIEGDETFDENGLGMKGTYWYDIQAYNEYCTKNKKTS